LINHLQELKQRAETLEVGNREMADLMQAKETLVERLRTQAQKQKVKWQKIDK
jgi:hypothetical protein